MGSHMCVGIGERSERYPHMHLPFSQQPWHGRRDLALQATWSFPGRSLVVTWSFMFRMLAMSHAQIVSVKLKRSAAALPNPLYL